MNKVLKEFEKQLDELTNFITKNLNLSKEEEKKIVADSFLIDRIKKAKNELKKTEQDIKNMNI
jgi:hypothetical protein